jgi:hypothetical protein
MSPQVFAEWLEPLSTSEKIRALAAIYSYLTIHTRELFSPEWTAGKQLHVLDMLHGMNEIHHTLSGALVAYAADGKYPHSLDGLGRMLLDNARKYHIEYFLESAVEHARSRITAPNS